MNRYRTTPGLAPAKATSTTTCQKCLKKGHYSYECKEPLQSRPYVSRASRTQQLRNPKLKPALTETKLNEGPADVLEAGPPALDKRDGPSTEEDAGTTSMTPEREAKRRRRSPSVSSVSSVSTISTNAFLSDRSDGAASKPSTSHRDHGGRPHRPKYRSESESPARRNRRTSRSSFQSPPRSSDAQGRSDARELRQRRRGANDPDEGRRSLVAKRQRLDRRSRSPRRESPSRARPDQAPKQFRQRSLSPYSRRLALTQAMNAGR